MKHAQQSDSDSLSQEGKPNSDKDSSVQVPGDTQIGKVLQLDKGGALSSIHGVAGCTEHNANPILGSSSRIDAGLGDIAYFEFEHLWDTAVSKQKGSVKDDFDVVQPKGIDADKVRVGYLSDSELPSRQRDGPITGFELCKLLSFRNFRCPCSLCKARKPGLSFTSLQARRAFTQSFKKFVK